MTNTTPDVHYLNCEKGFKSWFWTLDHKRLGLMYMWSVIAAFILGGIFALLVRMELMQPNMGIEENAALYGWSKELGPANLYNHIFCAQHHRQGEIT